jgi:hypothetical protein
VASIGAEGFKGAKGFIENELASRAWAGYRHFFAPGWDPLHIPAILAQYVDDAARTTQMSDPHGDEVGFVVRRQQFYFLRPSFVTVVE